MKFNFKKKKTLLRENKPWITPAISKLSTRLERVHKRLLKSPSAELEKEKSALKSRLQRMNRRAYWTYIDKMISPVEEVSATQRQKKFYTYIKHQRSSNIGIPPLKVNGELVSTPKAKAEALNDQFKSVFGEGIEYTEEDFTSKVQMKPVEMISTLTEVKVTEEGVLKMLQSLDPYKACGNDNIHPRVLRELAVYIAPILTTIYNSSLETGEIPQDWRDANVCPIYKKGNHYDPANYRPVSLTSVPCKILEHVLTSALMNHLESNKILCEEQHGFRKKRSCETQLLDFVEEVNENLSKGNQSDVIILDFAKAFDKVNHSLLIHKLKHYGVNGNVLIWFKSFLSDRRQAVVVDNTTSDWVSVSSGVPQGSVVGPALFLAYINDLPEQLSSLTRLFADDTAVYRLSASSLHKDQLQHDLQHLESWEKTWEMEFHPKKCTVLPISRSTDPIINTYRLHGHVLESVSSAKYLGVTLTKNLTWNSHIDNVCKKANKTLGFLRRNLKIGSQKVKDMAYKTFVRPILEYACTVWDPYTQEQIDKLEAVQRRAARFVVNRYHNTSSVTCMIDALQWPSLQHRRKINRLAMLKKFLDHDAIFNMKKIRPAPIRPRRAHSQQLVKIRGKQEYRTESFLPKTIREWNALPETTIAADTLDTFKSRVPLP